MTLIIGDYQGLRLIVLLLLICSVCSTSCHLKEYGFALWAKTLILILSTALGLLLAYLITLGLTITRLP